MRELSSRTVNELRPLVPPCEAAFPAHMAHWRLDGKPRTARWYTTDTHCPLPTPAERWRCIWVSLTTYPLPGVQGRLVGLGQSQAHPGIHGLLVVRRAARRARGEAPPRSVTALAQRLGMTAADATAMVRPPEAALHASAPPTAALAPPSPLVATMAPNGAVSAPRIHLRRRAMIAARTRTTRSKTCSGARPR
jgi:hypothetical protein